MSPKLQAKNLTYDTSLPPFLQRLRALNTSSADGRHERPLARPKRARNADDDAEDEPTYVDEAGVGLDGAELRSLGLTKGAAGEEEEAAAEEQRTEVGEKERETEKMAAIGAARRRKVGKVVGADEDGDGDAAKAAPKDEAQQAAPKPKKKAKKVKLSFGDDE